MQKIKDEVFYLIQSAVWCDVVCVAVAYVGQLAERAEVEVVNLFGWGTFHRCAL